MAHHVISLHNEDLPIRDLIGTLGGVEGKRRLMLRRMPNDEVFKIYDGNLVPGISNSNSKLGFESWVNYEFNFYI